MSLTPARAEEPLCGKWQMIYQKIGDRQDLPKPLPAIKITQSGTALEFHYTKGLLETVYLSFKAYMDGSPADMINDKGEKVGTARLTRKEGVYYLTLQKPNGQPEPGKLTLSQEGRILTIESDAIVPRRGLTHVVQQYSRTGMVP